MENTQQEQTRSLMVLRAAREAWERMAPLRERRRRFIRFTYGDQWSDLTRLPSGEVMTEEDAAVKAGRTPLTNNLIRRMVKAIVGRFRMERSEARQADAVNHDVINRLEELDARTLEEFLISGMAIHRVCRETRPGGMGAWVDNVSPDRFFCNAFSDLRGCDIELAGWLRDMSLGELVMRYSFGSAKRAARLKKIYGSMLSADSLLTPAMEEGDVASFSMPRAGRCRVIEVWTLECRERLRCHDPLTSTVSFLPLSEAAGIKRTNARRRREKLPQIDSRWEVATLWHCRCLAPDGTLLDSYDSPLADGSLPFSVKFYPLVGGEVHSLVEDVVGQQKYVNRLISMLDHIMSISAKGVLLFPDQCLTRRALDPERADRERREIADAWAQPGSFITYHAYENHAPQQISSNATDIGAREMLQTQIQLFEDISGVNSSLMGKAASGGVGAERYESEVRNSAVSILDLMRTFADFTAIRDAKLALC